MKLPELGIWQVSSSMFKNQKNNISILHYMFSTWPSDIIDYRHRFVESDVMSQIFSLCSSHVLMITA